LILGIIVVQAVIAWPVACAAHMLGLMYRRGSWYARTPSSQPLVQQPSIESSPVP
jgi:hypothetical protein